MTAFQGVKRGCSLHMTYQLMVMSAFSFSPETNRWMWQSWCTSCAPYCSLWVLHSLWESVWDTMVLQCTDPQYLLWFHIVLQCVTVGMWVNNTGKRKWAVPCSVGSRGESGPDGLQVDPEGPEPSMGLELGIAYGLVSTAGLQHSSPQWDLCTLANRFRPG